MDAPASHTDADLHREKITEIEVAFEMRRTRYELIRLACEDRELLVNLHAGQIARVRALLAQVSETLAASKEALAEQVPRSV